MRSVFHRPLGLAAKVLLEKQVTVQASDVLLQTVLPFPTQRTRIVRVPQAQVTGERPERGSQWRRVAVAPGPIRRPKRERIDGAVRPDAHPTAFGAIACGRKLGQRCERDVNDQAAASRLKEVVDGHAEQLVLEDPAYTRRVLQDVAQREAHLPG